MFLESCSKIIRHRISVEYILKKFNEYEKFKELILTKEQINVIEYMNREKIVSINVNDKSDNSTLKNSNEKIINFNESNYDVANKNKI